MPLPETIPVKYTEEEAGAISMRPVVRQTFRAPELVDMIVGVTGKNQHRVRQILRAGTVVFHSYRYWWQGFEADDTALGEILARYPDADPSLPFCSALASRRPRRLVRRFTPRLSLPAPGTKLVPALASQCATP